MVRFFQNGTYKILQKFATIEDADLEEKILLAVHRVRQVFSEEVLATRPIKKTIPSYLVGDTIVSSTSLSHFLKEFHFEDIEDIPLIYPESKMLQTYEDRIDCRNWFTFTIDGADARDLDDALSLARYANGDTLLAVHIADVAEYVTEASPLDREALIRSTSIYTPGKVIPMLPEYLSNDLCSLHPGEAKFALTCFMRLNTK
jgi:exoribonuclease R